MSITRIIAVVLIITALAIVVALFIFGTKNVVEWLKLMSVDLLLAIIMAAIAGFIIDRLYRRYSPQSKILKTTVTHSPSNNVSYAQLILPNNNNIIVSGAERIIGREDFVGVVSTDKLLFIGKDHFRVKKKPDGFYIQDLNTKNGTKLNGKEVEGSSGKLLNSGDEILVGKTLKIRYKEKK
jgi:pSer/pThr/pTyr-binding forkhead associated (FHA) protein